MRREEQIAYSHKPVWYILETLPHLPSPETVSVLGELLYDERDAATKPYKDPCTGMHGMHPNSVLAREALQLIGLRDPGIAEPVFVRLRQPEKGEPWTSEDALQAEFEQRTAQRFENLRPWRGWWEAVKAGERKFSFKGQSVEYRFKPDGTWETIPIANPPDDGPKAPEAIPVTRDEKRPPAAASNVGANGGKSPWLWIGAGVAVLAIVIGFLKIRSAR